MKKFNKFGALAQLVEQWPFKPFVTGSNPVRPNMLNIIAFLILSLYSTLSAADISTPTTIESSNGIILNANLLSSHNHNPIFIIVHGTRGHKSMEIIKTLSNRFYDEGYDVLNINLSYGFNDREDEFLSCEIKHQHSEHDSVKEILTWYKYLIAKGYKDIRFIGHSRGAFNVIQTLALIENNQNINAYLLAPIIDTYEGTRDYYVNDLNIPYDLIINSNYNYDISEKYSLINFLFCENAKVSSQTFRSYLDFSQDEKKYPFTYNIISLLKNINSPITIFSGTEDEILLDSYEKFKVINKHNINHIVIDGAGHFFRDLYLDDIVDNILENSY